MGNLVSLSASCGRGERGAGLSHLGRNLGWRRAGILSRDPERLHYLIFSHSSFISLSPPEGCSMSQDFLILEGRDFSYFFPRVP